MPLDPEKSKLLETAFRPHAAIEDPGSFFGRDRERARVREALSEPGLQVVVYGEGGCGKTSLVNVATEGFPRVKVFCEKAADFSRILRDIALKLQEFDPQRIVYDAFKDTITARGVVLPLGRMTGNDLLSILPADQSLCLVLDELDRVEDRRAIPPIAELAKNVATSRPNLTLVMVGVAETAGGLLDGHASNYRNIREVQLDRMENSELRSILTHGEEVLNLKFSEEVSTEILQLCDRMPYYLHLLARSAAKAALEVGSPIVELEDFSRGSIEAASDADQQLRNTYELARTSERGTRIYQRIIWALANLQSKNNNLAEITRETNKIALGEKEEAVTPKGIGGALKRLASPEKGNIIYQPGTGVYSFTSPLMKGFIRLVRYSQ